MKRNINVYLGVMGSGKDTQAKRNTYTQIYNFKDPLLRMIGDIFKCDLRNDKEYEYFKKCIPGLHHTIFGRCLSALLIKYYPNIPTGREYLQKIGTEIVRQLSPNYWVDTNIGGIRRESISNINPNVSFSICDCRFSNELSAILDLKKEGFKIKFVFCNYHSHRYDDKSKHKSEKLPQFLTKEFISLGYKDMDVIPMKVIKRLLKKYE